MNIKLVHCMVVPMGCFGSQRHIIMVLEQKNNEEAYVWGRMAVFAFDEYQKRKDSVFLRDKTYIIFREQVINHATEEIQNEITEPHDLNNVVNKYFHEIITLDYYQWKNDIEPVPPKP